MNCAASSCSSPECSSLQGPFLPKRRRSCCCLNLASPDRPYGLLQPDQSAHPRMHCCWMPPRLTGRGGVCGVWATAGGPRPWTRVQAGAVRPPTRTAGAHAAAGGWGTGGRLPPPARAPARQRGAAGGWARPSPASAARAPLAATSDPASTAAPGAPAASAAHQPAPALAPGCRPRRGQPTRLLRLLSQRRAPPPHLPRCRCPRRYCRPRRCPRTCRCAR
jgi:hypothetical protein